MSHFLFYNPGTGARVHIEAEALVGACRAYRANRVNRNAAVDVELRIYKAFEPDVVAYALKVAGLPGPEGSFKDPDRPNHVGQKVVFHAGITVWTVKHISDNGLLQLGNGSQSRFNVAPSRVKEVPSA